MFHTNGNISENRNDQPDRYLVESEWIEAPLPAHHIPPDPQQDIDDVTNRYKLNLQLQEKHISRLGMQHRPFTMVDGLTEGNDWTENTDGSWFIPSMELQPAEPSDCADVSYCDNFVMDGLKFQKCEQPQHAPQLPLDPAF